MPSARGDAEARGSDAGREPVRNPPRTHVEHDGGGESERKDEDGGHICFQTLTSIVFQNTV